MLRQEGSGIAVELVGARGAQPQHVAHGLAVRARRGAIEGIERAAQDMAVLLHPVYPCARVVQVLVGAARQSRPRDLLVLRREDGLLDSISRVDKRAAEIAMPTPRRTSRIFGSLICPC